MRLVFASAAAAAMGLQQWKRGLFTHEDPFNVHKLFGFPCLLHFILRTLSVPIRPFSDMGFTSSAATPAGCATCPGGAAVSEGVGFEGARRCSTISDGEGGAGDMADGRWGPGGDAVRS